MVYFKKELRSNNFNKGFFSLVPVLAVLAVLILGGGAYVVSKKHVKQPKDTASINVERINGVGDKTTNAKFASTTVQGLSNGSGAVILGKISPDEISEFLENSKSIVHANAQNYFNECFLIKRPENLEEDIPYIGAAYFYEKDDSKNSFTRCIEAGIRNNPTPNGCLLLARTLDGNKILSEKCFNNYFLVISKEAIKIKSLLGNRANDVGKICESIKNKTDSEFKDSCTKENKNSKHSSSMCDDVLMTFRGLCADDCRLFTDERKRDICFLSKDNCEELLNIDTRDYCYSDLSSQNKDKKYCSLIDEKNLKQRNICLSGCKGIEDVNQRDMCFNFDGIRAKNDGCNYITDKKLKDSCYALSRGMSQFAQ